MTFFSRRGSGDAALFVVLALLMAFDLIGLGIGLATFFGPGYDFRISESEVLLFNLGRCAQHHDFFAPGFDLSQCSLDASVLSENHFISLKRADGRVFQWGPASYQEACGFTVARGLTYPRCLNGTWVINGSSISYLVGSAQTARVIT